MGAHRDLRQDREPGAATRQRLLDAAERLLAERGFEGTSLRAVTQAAGTSVSAANYHFGSKEALLGETFRRRVEPVNRRRLELLSALERAAGPDGPELEDILEAFLRPVVELRAAALGRGEGADHRQLVTRLYADAPRLLSSLKEELFGAVTERFQAALARALPGVPADRVALLYQLIVGVLVHVIGGQVDGSLRNVPAPPGMEGEGAPPVTSCEPLLRSLVRFGAAGLRAVQGEARVPAARALGGSRTA